MAERVAAESGVDVEFIRTNRLRKPTKSPQSSANAVMQPGLVAILSAMEPCSSYSPVTTRRRARLSCDRRREVSALLLLFLSTSAWGCALCTCRPGARFGCNFIATVIFGSKATSSGEASPTAWSRTPFAGPAISHKPSGSPTNCASGLCTANSMPSSAATLRRSPAWASRTTGASTKRSTQPTSSFAAAKIGKPSTIGQRAIASGWVPERSSRDNARKAARDTRFMLPDILRRLGGFDRQRRMKERCREKQRGTLI